MRHFTSVYDLPDLNKAIKTALEIKNNPYAFQQLGKNKTMVLIFFDSSLRTRLSTQKAAMNLGMNTMVLNVNQDGWKLESELGVVMDGDKVEHLREAIPVIGRYCDIIGVRAFARFESKEDDYSEKILNQFIRFAGVPIISMEAATRHPLQSFADHVTIEEFKTTARPKVVMSWAPHPAHFPRLYLTHLLNGCARPTMNWSLLILKVMSLTRNSWEICRWNTTRIKHLKELTLYMPKTGPPIHNMVKFSQKI